MNGTALAREAKAPRDRARVLRELLEASNSCRIMLRDEEVETIEDAIALYEDEEGQTST